MRRFIIGAVAAAAVLTSTATPANAAPVCTPPEAGPPVCIDGFDGDVEAVQDAAWTAFNTVFSNVLVVTTAGDDTIDQIPEPACAPAPSSTCVTGLREAVKQRYVTFGSFALGVTYHSVCTALQRNACA